jgi:hypothetical protein
MKKTLLTFLFLCSLFVIGSTAATDPVDKVILFLDHRVSIAVPQGFMFTSGRDENGTIVAQLADPKQANKLQVQFQPDPSSRLGTERQQMDFLAEACRQYAEGSVEHAFEFKPLEPHSGHGMYCTFTDATLAGHPPPKGEFLHITTGVKVWPGWVIVFTLLSNDTAAKEYLTLLALVKDSFEEKPPPAPPKS